MKNLSRIWKTNLAINLISGIVLVFMEWLFFITKPSFLSTSSFSDKLAVLFYSTVFVFGMLLLLSLPIIIFCSFVQSRTRLISHLLTIIPAIMLTFLALLMIDNFTYTMFKFGISNSSGLRRVIYLFVWLSLFTLIYIKLTKSVFHKLSTDAPEHSAYLPVIITLFISVLLTSLFFRLPTELFPDKIEASSTDGFPNIILVTADGVNAKNMSLYGYERETTPFLDSIKDQLVISNNHFTNSANTGGAIVSILNGKYPTTTRMLYPPDILKGDDSYEHLSGILRENGYYTAQFAVEHYVDSTTQNMQDAFDESNGKKVNRFLPTNLLSERFPTDSRLFLVEVESRIIDRAKHIFFIESMENTFLQITKMQKDYKDIEKIDDSIRVISETKQPVFVHIHWMGTHGGRYYPDSTKFSAGIDRENQEPWIPDLYDDSIVDLDSGLEYLFTELSRINELSDTIILLTSDHGHQFTVKNRLPMFLYIPGNNLLQIRSSNTQHIDIAPTILDLLNLDQPDWMFQGVSMFEENRKNDLVFATGTLRSVGGKVGNILDDDYLLPPFYQFDYMSIIDCDRYYWISLEEHYYWSVRSIPSYAGTCNISDYLSKSEIRNALIDRLVTDGFLFDEAAIPELP